MLFKISCVMHFYRNERKKKKSLAGYEQLQRGQGRSNTLVKHTLVIDLNELTREGTGFASDGPTAVPVLFGFGQIRPWPTPC